jgi:hypothetical protein
MNSWLRKMPARGREPRFSMRICHSGKKKNRCIDFMRDYRIELSAGIVDAGSVWRRKPCCQRPIDARLADTKGLGDLRREASLSSRLLAALKATPVQTRVCVTRIPTQPRLGRRSRCPVETGGRKCPSSS